VYVSDGFHRVDPTQGWTARNRVTICGDRVAPDVPTLTVIEANQTDRDPEQRLSTGRTCDVCDERLPAVKEKVQLDEQAKLTRARARERKTRGRTTAKAAGKKRKKGSHGGSVWPVSGGLPTLGKDH
jgi:hypothetical protein